MNNSLKIGAVSGLVAGFVLGVAYEFFNQLAVGMGLYAPWSRPFVTNNFVVNIPLFGFWGVVLGIIYSRVYSVIPRKSILKGLIYGLILYFIISLRNETFNLAFGRFLQVAGAAFTGVFSYLSFGLVLSILYELLCGKYQLAISELRPKEYDMRGGILAGAIAGSAGGFVNSVGATVPALGLVQYPEGFVPFSFDFWMSQAGALILVNLIWGTVFGAILSKVYSLVPGEKVKKGLCYGLIVFFINSFQIGTWVVVWGLYHNALLVVSYLAWALFVMHGAAAIVFGLVLGALYRKPGD